MRAFTPHCLVMGMRSLKGQGLGKCMASTYFSALDFSEPLLGHKQMSSLGESRFALAARKLTDL